MLAQAAKSLGYESKSENNGFVVSTPKGVITINNGLATALREASSLVNTLRVQYSREIVKIAALKKGWNAQAVSQNKYLLRKR